jgi:hypothetical protein
VRVVFEARREFLDVLSTLTWVRRVRAPGVPHGRREATRPAAPKRKEAEDRSQDDEAGGSECDELKELLSLPW